MINTNRHQDNQNEKIINHFLFNAFFNKKYKATEYVNDVERQCQGIDIVADGKNYDIKAQSAKKYINNPTNTYIVELSFINKKDERVNGWFLNDDLKTDYYVFSWVNKAEVSDKGELLNLKEVEILIVDKAKLKESVFESFNEETIKNIQDKLIEDSKVMAKPAFQTVNHKFVMTTSLPEKPICIVLTKDRLKKYSVGHYFVNE